jgi:hypothetical protein
MSTTKSRKAAYDTAYEATPEQKKNRAARGRARYAYEKTHGDLPKTVDIDHRVMLDQGGTNAKSNTRPVAVAKNRGWRGEHPKAYGKKK